MDRELKGYQIEKFVDAGPEMTDIYLPVPLPRLQFSDGSQHRQGRRGIANRH